MDNKYNINQDDFDTVLNSLYIEYDDILDTKISDLEQEKKVWRRYFMYSAGLLALVLSYQISKNR